MITKLDDGVFSGLTNLQYLYVLDKIFEDTHIGYKIIYSIKLSSTDRIKIHLTNCFKTKMLFKNIFYGDFLLRYN